MLASDFRPGYPGILIPLTGQAVAFAPNPLPTPGLQPSFSLMHSLSAADVALSHLNGIAKTLTNPEILVRPFLRREALESNRIEGTQTNYSDLLLFEAASNARKATADPDTRVVANYMAALNHGLLAAPKQRLTRELISDVHRILMRNYNEHRTRPGQYRDGQVTIGSTTQTAREARFVPAPASFLPDLLSEFEHFLEHEREIPLLIRVALAHYQFETIHPFWDGNGRVGRLLISLMICSNGALSRPILYLSGYFERRRREYYDRLLAVSQNNDWHGWVCFFLEGVRMQAEDAIARIAQLQRLHDEYRTTLSARKGGAFSNVRLIEMLFETQVVSVAMVRERLGLSSPSSRDCIERLVEAGILQRAIVDINTHFWYAPKIMEALEPVWDDSSVSSLAVNA